MFYLATRTNTIPREQWTIPFSEHESWMQVQHEAGTILLSGPTPENRGAVYLVRARTREEAERVVRTDPYIASGQCGLELVEWNIRHAFGIGGFGAERPASSAAR